MIKIIVILKIFFYLFLLCKLSDRQTGLTMKVCSEQLAAIAAVLTPTDWAKVVIAYEPVWAIGTGVTASPAQAEETHKDIRYYKS
jgi:triosephosphate isomerase